MAPADFEEQPAAAVVMDPADEVDLMQKRQSVDPEMMMPADSEKVLKLRLQKRDAKEASFLPNRQLYWL